MADYQNPYAHGSTSRPMDMSLDAGLRSYMLGVYNYMALGVAFTGVVTLLMSNMPGLMQAVAMGPMKWVLFAALIGMGWFAPRVIMSGSIAAAQGMYWAYAGLWGVLISPWIAFLMGSTEGATDIARAFFITASIFGGMSLYGYTTKRDLAPMATFFMMAAIGLLVAIVINVFFVQSTLFSLLTSCGVVLVFSGITAFETQMVKQMYYSGDSRDAQKRKSIFGAFALYGSFITLFIHILNILGIMRSD